MRKNDIKKLIKFVESNVFSGTNLADFHEYENWTFDHKGNLPVYIFDAISSYGYEEHKVHIMFYAIQPSGNALVFIVPHNIDDPFGEGILPSGKPFSLTIGRYAEITVEEANSGDKTYLDVKKIKLIPDSKIEAIKTEKPKAKKKAKKGNTAKKGGAL